MTLEADMVIVCWLYQPGGPQDMGMIVLPYWTRRWIVSAQVALMRPSMWWVWDWWGLEMKRVARLLFHHFSTHQSTLIYHNRSKSSHIYWQTLRFHVKSLRFSIEFLISITWRAETRSRRLHYHNVISTTNAERPPSSPELLSVNREALSYR